MSEFTCIDDIINKKKDNYNEYLSITMKLYQKLIDDNWVEDKKHNELKPYSYRFWQTINEAKFQIYLTCSYTYVSKPTFDLRIGDPYHMILNNRYIENDSYSLILDLIAERL